MHSNGHAIEDNVEKHDGEHRKDDRDGGTGAEEDHGCLTFLVFTAARPIAHELSRPAASANPLRFR